MWRFYKHWYTSHLFFSTMHLSFHVYFIFFSSPSVSLSALHLYRKKIRWFTYCQHKGNQGHLTCPVKKPHAWVTLWIVSINFNPLLFIVSWLVAKVIKNKYEMKTILLFILLLTTLMFQALLYKWPLILICSMQRRCYCYFQKKVTEFCTTVSLSIHLLMGI